MGQGAVERDAEPVLAKLGLECVPRLDGKTDAAQGGGTPKTDAA